MTSPRLKYDLTGLRFGRLRVLGRGPDALRGVPRWDCRCDCGTLRTIESGSLRYGSTRSCGCYDREQKRLRCGDKNPSWRGGAQEGRKWVHCRFGSRAPAP
jgi:hypothetical protein